MKILAIESSCDDTAAAVVEDGRKVLSNVVASQVDAHIVYGGVVPEIASRMHTEAIHGTVSEALHQANTTMDEIDAVAVTYAPGLIGALLIGVSFAKGLAFSANKPLIPVHHLRSHIAANYITTPNLEPPFLALVVSGGHSHIVQVKSYTEFEIIGRTMDDAAGECMDKAARALGLPYPGGLNLDRVAQNGNPKAYQFPRPRVDGSAFDFSFSGLKTAAINLIHNAEQKNEAVCMEDFGASYIHAVVRCLTDNTLRAAQSIGEKRIALAGGVSANRVLRREMTALCEQKGLALYFPELKYCGDNAAMVGAQGYYEFLSGKQADLSLNAYATMPIDKTYF
ncbi:MAG TPA: tRNA (adenosine(37)-N6)-threonylcarbamoyltransferase complex transferase subunit TsaD [Ruminococcaceae bacterium]|nr:tRNA (adenosine(37)-N6)-threonylcarbamoyltransferase complex transferase subunit TsaD [Oscillospiraceae bacterium]